MESHSSSSRQRSREKIASDEALLPLPFADNIVLELDDS